MPWTKVYASKAEFEKASEDKGQRGLSYGEAIREALCQLLESDPSVIVLGEGVDDSGGIFGSTKGLADIFGDSRVMDIPLAENGLTGVAVGAAIAGMRPVFVHMRADFLPLSLDQIINHAAKVRYMSGGRVSAPIVIRALIGRGWGSAAQHSQSLAPLFLNIPGLKVVMPATPYDAKGLLRSAVYDGSPVVVLEHRWLYGKTGYVPKEPYTVPIGRGVVRRTGADVTIVASSLSVHDSLDASAALEVDGIDCEVLDLRTVRPIDKGLILDSVKKTGRLVTAETGWAAFGIGAEIAAVVSEHAFGALKAPVERVGLPDAPTPASPALEDAYYPGPGEIASAVRRVFGYAG